MLKQAFPESFVSGQLISCREETVAGFGSWTTHKYLRLSGLMRYNKRLFLKMTILAKDILKF